MSVCARLSPAMGLAVDTEGDLERRVPDPPHARGSRSSGWGTHLADAEERRYALNFAGSTHAQYC